MGSCAAPSAKGDDKFITTDYLQQCHISTLSGLCRIALWYGVNATRPEAIGVGLPGQTA
ncbi:hypothetical protein OV281_21405 [Salmonella enterica subsp. enterica serovar 1,4,[5],12:i:-]|nr:hypothetical protein [Salmonella enterica subsp. enterica serovar 1,4,[5],12:i:-]